jgi:hypothetical protein
VSIIKDALAKAQSTSEKRMHKLGGEAAGRIRKRRTRLAGRLFIAALVACFALLGGAAFYFSVHNAMETDAVVSAPDEMSDEAVSVREDIVGAEEREELEEGVVAQDRIAEALKNRAELAAVKPPQRKRTFDLRGIMHSPTKPLAIVDNSVVTEGEAVGEYRIVKIGRDFVRFVGIDDVQFDVRLRQ